MSKTFSLLHSLDNIYLVPPVCSKYVLWMILRRVPQVSYLTPEEFAAWKRCCHHKKLEHKVGGIFKWRYRYNAVDIQRRKEYPYLHSQLGIHISVWLKDQNISSVIRPTRFIVFVLCYAPSVRPLPCLLCSWLYFQDWHNGCKAMCIQ